MSLGQTKAPVGIFTYIYHKNQPNVGNIPYMDGIGIF